jgi:phosphate transport system permease protein
MAVSAARVASRRIWNILFVGFCYLVTALALTALAAILWSLITQGVGGINLDFFTMSTPAAGSRGGVLNAIVGSLMISALAMAMALMVGIMAGTWLAEYSRDSRYGGVVRFLNDVLLSAPSILIGLFVWPWLVFRVFHHFNGVAGAVALAIIAVPVITQTTEGVLRLQPTSLRESGVALGTPFWTVIRTILWRAAGGGILTGALLAFARISGETAPLLLTVTSNQFFSLDLTKPMANLPVVIAQDALTPYPDLNKLAWGAALLIAGTVLSVTIIARILTPEQKR